MNGPYPSTSLAAQKIAAFEGFRSTPYLDSAGVATIGYGSTHYPNGTAVKMSDPPISLAWAMALLNHDLTAVATYLWSVLTAHPNLNQWSAMLSLAYNMGAHAIANSTLVRLFENGSIALAANEFLRWDHARVNGVLVEVEGLKNRRIAERALFLSKENFNG